MLITKLWFEFRYCEFRHCEFSICEVSFCEFSFCGFRHCRFSLCRLSPLRLWEFRHSCGGKGCVCEFRQAKKVGVSVKVSSGQIFDFFVRPPKDKGLMPRQNTSCT